MMLKDNGYTTATSFVTGTAQPHKIASALTVAAASRASATTAPIHLMAAKNESKLTTHRSKVRHLSTIATGGRAPPSAAAAAPLARMHLNTTALSLGHSTGLGQALLACNLALARIRDLVM